MQIGWPNGMTYQARYVFYDPRTLDWEERLAEARANRPAGECGMIIALPAGCKLWPPKGKNDTPAQKKVKK
jgi:hypothetical protein